MNPQKRLYTSIIIVGVLAILFIVFLIYPVFRAIVKNSQDFLSEKKRLISLAQEEENLKKIEDLYKAYQSDLNKIENFFVDPEAPIEFVNFLEETAKNSQLRLEISSIVKKAEKEDPWENLSIQLFIYGSYPNLLKFLEKLENSSYLIEMVNLNINRLSESELKLKGFEKFSTGDINSSLLIKVYTK
jgi:Tfp pilus assembly protein PilO